MMRLCLIVTLFVITDMVFSSPLSLVDVMELYERRNLEKSQNKNYLTHGALALLGRRGVVPKGTKTWPGGVVLYDISNIQPGPERDVILEAMGLLSKDTAVVVNGETIPCITFRPRTAADRDYTTFNYGDGCAAYIGYWRKNVSQIWLAQDGCFYPSVIQHEMMHVLGFDHEMKRSDRDQSVSVDLNKVDPDLLDQYNKYAEGSTVDLKTPYDVNSIMHYDPKAFQKLGTEGVVMQSLGKLQIPDQNPDARLSPIDIQEVRTLYQCKG